MTPLETLPISLLSGVLHTDFSWFFPAPSVLTQGCLGLICTSHPPQLQFFCLLRSRICFRDARFSWRNQGHRFDPQLMLTAVGAFCMTISFRCVINEILMNFVPVSRIPPFSWFFSVAFEWDGTRDRYDRVFGAHLKRWCWSRCSTSCCDPLDLILVKTC